MTLVPVYAVLLASAPSPPASPGADLPAIEVRAERLPDRRGPFPLAGRPVGRGEIDRRPGGRLDDVLRPVAGLRVTSLGAPWAGSAVSLRGSTTDQVLVLVDGRRRNAAQGGGVDLSSIALDTVESVEVFRGGASALWGSDAIGGAIAVTTRAARGGEWSLRASSGSFGQRTAEAAGSASLTGGWAVRGTLRRFQADGGYSFRDDARGTDQTVRNGDLTRTGASLRADGERGRWRLRLDGEAAASDRGVPGSEEFPTPQARLDDHRWSTGLRAEAPRSAWGPVMDVAVSRSERRYLDPGSPFGVVDELHRNLRWEGDAGVRRRWGRTLARAYAGGSRDALESTTDGTRHRDAGNARVHLTHERDVAGVPVRGMGALRLDAVDGFAPFWTPRAGVLADVAPGLVAVRASAGASYRAPSFDELFWAPRASAAGNPDLRAERGRDVDVGVAFGAAGGRIRAAADAFVRTVDDLIQWIPGASGVWRPHNVGRARIRGIETELEARIWNGSATRVRVGGSGTYLDARDRTGEPNVDGRRLVYRPEWSGTARLIVGHRAAGELETQWQYVGETFVTRANTKSLPGHWQGEVRWRRPLTDSIRIDAAVTNVLDTRARDFRDYPLPGRAWQAGLMWSGGRS